MPPNLRRAAALLCILAALLVCALALLTQARRRAERPRIAEEQALARTLGILRTGTPAHPNVLKVLFYGQSITKSGWDRLTLEHWRQTYPNTVFVSRNMALGGFGSVMLLRTTARDVNEYYPDLIVFHDYGDHRAYEQILRIFRSQTAADVILQTDHGEVLPDSVCPEGLATALHPPPGCVGRLWWRQRLWGDEMSYHKLPTFAAKYGLALEPQRLWWRDSLLRNHLPPQALLSDQIHPNAAGRRLIADLFDGYFDTLVQHWNGQTESTATDLPPDPAAFAQGVPFDGNRAELLTAAPLAAPPQASIDGVSASSIDGCFQVTRTSSTGTEPDWPALRRITLNHDHTPADWTATVTDISPDQHSFAFSVQSSPDGEQGSGSSAEPFTARSGQLSFEPDDWMLARAFAEKHLPLASPFQVKWSVQFVCGATPEAVSLGLGRTQYRYLLATGLPNGRHILRLTLAPPDIPALSGLRLYRPPLIGP